VIIRPSEPADRDALLAFIAEMGFNPRDAATWDGLKMLAMTAWDGHDLIGAIPLEPRTLQMESDQWVPIVHETVVAVRPEFRGKGLGSQLQQAIADAPPRGAKLATVFREEPDSPTYRWYASSGFAPVIHVDSWFIDNPSEVATRDDFEFLPAEECDDRWPSIEKIRRQVLSQSPGLLSRRQRPLKPWLEIHPYRSRYAFHFVTVRQGADLSACALVGVGAMHSQTTRVDILEFCVIDNEPALSRQLLDAVITCAARSGWHPIRWPLASSDPLTQIAAEAGFIARWGFDMLAKPLDASARNIMPAIGGSHGRYAGIDYA
jgi:GNAT superfamily N-acetyltransferase